MSRQSTAPESSPMRPMMRPLPPSAAMRSRVASGARLLEAPSQLRQRRRRERMRRVVLRTMAAAVLAFTASLLTARPAHDVGASGERPTRSEVAPGARHVSLAQ